MRRQEARLLLVERVDLGKCPDQIRPVTASQRRQRTGDADVGAGLAGLRSRLVGEVTGEQVEFGEAVLPPLLCQLAPDYTVGIRGDDLGARGDVVAVDLADGVGSDDQGIRRPDRIQDLYPAKAQLPPHAAVEKEWPVLG